MDTNLVEDLRRLEPFDWSGWLVGLVVVAVLAALALALARRGRRRALGGMGMARGEDVTPWDEAWAALDRLRPLRVPERSREYGIAVAGVVRRYLERRYALRVRWQVTEEFLAEAATAPVVPGTCQDRLREFLEACDLMKFARARGEAAELETVHAAAMGLVESTRPAAEAALAGRGMAELDGGKDVGAGGAAGLGRGRAGET